MLQLVGYHGTSMENARSIKSNNFIISSSCANNRYGDGIYFWAESNMAMAQARTWAMNAHPGDDPEIIISTLQCNTGLSYVDLISTEYQCQIISLYDKFVKEDKSLERSKNSLKLTMKILNYLFAEHKKEFATDVRFFSAGFPLHNLPGLLIDYQQIVTFFVIHVVLDTTCIVHSNNRYFFMDQEA